jgi:hypothetical protein
MNSTKKQERRKGKPRGRPWPKGISGNPGGRPKGAKNKLTLAVLAGNRSLTLDRTGPLEIRFDAYVQAGIKFCKETLVELNPGSPVPIQPEMLDLREFYREIMWKGRLYFIQNGWVFDWSTHKAVKV